MALISLPGARLIPLAQELATFLDLPYCAQPLECRTAGIYVLESDFFQTEAGVSQIRDFRLHGNLVISIQMKWEDSWRAVGMDRPGSPQDFPWRKLYREQAKLRLQLQREEADITVIPQGTVQQIAWSIAESVQNYEEASKI